MIAPSYLLLDLGGTYLSKYLISDDNSVKHENYSIENTNPVEKILDLIAIYKHTFPEITIILGLPGPVKEGSNTIFCPPLNRELEITQIRNLDVYIVNDVISIIPLLTASRLVVDNTILLTIGTSIGSALITSNPPKLSDKFQYTKWLDKAKSIEIAHFSSRMLFESFSIDPQPATLAGLFSVSSLRYILNKQDDLLLNESGVPIVQNKSIVEEAEIEILSPLIDKWFNTLVNTVTQLFINHLKIARNNPRVIVHGGINLFLPRSYTKSYLERCSTKLKHTSEIIFYHN